MAKRIGLTTDVSVRDCACEISDRIFVVIANAIACGDSLNDYDFLLTDWYALRATLVDAVRELDSYNA